MYKKFSITIFNKEDVDDQKKLIFDVYNTKIAQKWAREIQKRYKLYETERFKSWNIDEDIEEQLIRKLNNEIKIINNFFPKCIQCTITKGTDQNTLNYLHKIFETLRGEIKSGTNQFNLAPDNVKYAIQNLNLLIHRYEDYNSSKPTELHPNHPFASIVGTFRDRPRYKLDEKDYEHFTFNWKFGEVYINYCEVGKPILDVFKDNDDLVGENNIRPLHYYSADFMIKFGPDTPKWYYDERSKRLKKWLTEKGLDSNDKHLSLGLIPVAKFNRKESRQDKFLPEQIVKNLSAYQKLLSVDVL